MKKKLEVNKQAAKFDRLPPQNIEAEQSILGSLMLDKNAVIKIADIIAAEDFYRRTHQLIFETISGLFEQGEPIDILSVSNRLEERKKLTETGGASYLTDLINSVPSASNIVHYAKIVQKKKIHRDLIDASQAISQLGYQEIEDVENIVDEAERRIFAISQRSVKQSFVRLKPALEDAYERLGNLHENSGDVLRGIPTGFADLDNLLNGLQKSDFIILAARPSLGKTTLSLDIARHVATKEKRSVGIFSLEMSSSQLVDRILAAQAQVDLQKLRTGKFLADKDFSFIDKAKNELSESAIFIDDTPGTTVMEIRTKARRLQAEQGLDLIIVDYIQLMEEPRIKTENIVQKVTEISRGLKSLARELDIPVLALSQLNRGVEHRTSKDPFLSDLRDSGSLEQDADIVILISGERDRDNENITTIKIAKHRNGPTGEIQLNFNKKLVRFETLDKRYQ